MQHKDENPFKKCECCKKVPHSFWVLSANIIKQQVELQKIGIIFEVTSNLKSVYHLNSLLCECPLEMLDYLTLFFGCQPNDPMAAWSP
jgi:hypothetical protein